MNKYLLIITILLISKVSAAQQTYTPDEAAKHIGDSIKVCGKVYGGRFFETSNNTPTLLNIGAAFPNSPLTIMIPAKVRDALGYAPEVELREKMICVTGTVLLYKNKPEIIVKNIEQLEVKK